MSVQSPPVIPAKASIQAFLLDSRQKHAGMTLRDKGHFIVLSFTKQLLPSQDKFLHAVTG
jgi:hypothetical protein